MAYRKTQNVLDHLAGRRDEIIVATRNVITRDGASFKMQDVADEAGIAVGSLYNHFADQTELLAAVVAERLQADLTAMANAMAGIGRRPMEVLAAAIVVYVHRTRATRGLAATITATPAYRAGIVRALEPLLRAVQAPCYAMLATGIYGALNGVLLTGPGAAAWPKNAQVVTAMALRMAGLEEPAASDLAVHAQTTVRRLGVAA